MQVKVSSAPAASSVAPDGVMPSQSASLQRAEFERDVAGVLDDDLVFDRLAEFAGQFRRAVKLPSPSISLVLFDRERGFGGDFGGDLVGASWCRCLRCLRSRLRWCRCRPPSSWVQVKVSSAPARVRWRRTG